MKENNVVVIPAAIPEDKKLDKYGGWEWMEISIKSWKYWCEKNGYQFVVYDKPSYSNFKRYRITWQRFFDIFDFLDEKNIEYDKILLTDACTMPKWDCPDFFKLTGDNFTAIREMDNLRWVYESIQGYKSFFDNFELDITRYINAGFVIFNKSHKEFFESFKNLYMENIDTLVELQDEIVKRGTDQTAFNYWLQMNEIHVDSLPIPYSVSHLHRKDFLSYNWQLEEDRIPFFIKYCYVWMFSGFDKTQRDSLMKQTWDLVKDNYK